MQEVDVEEINWLWYPYIPFGKITILQGDGGDGKTTLILAIAAAVTQGLPLPESNIILQPVNVIYQTAEDGLGDTIKPRLLQAGADCNHVMVIDESEKELTLSDSRIEKAIVQTNTKLFILDPLQAYLGASVDMHRANEVRPIFKQLSGIAERTGCAIVIIGHMNKGNSKSQYRGLGSVDIQAAARSVLTVGRVKENLYMRAFVQGKSNLAPEGSAIAFELDPVTGFRWIGKYEIGIDELLQGGSCTSSNDSTYERAENLLKTELADRDLDATELLQMASDQGISERTFYKAKAALGIESIKRGTQWFWTLPPVQDCKAEHCISIENVQS